MTEQRARRLLILAFALSLIVHLIIATGVHWHLPISRDETQVVEIEHRPRVLRVSKLVTPIPHTPPPHPVRTPVPATAAPAPRKPVRTPRGSGSPSGPGGTGTSITRTPTPVATATAAPCESHDIPAALAVTPPPAEIAPAVRARATDGTTRVQVRLDARGGITGATIVESSGNHDLDLVALTMAKSAEYTPALKACKAIASDYVFSARFIPW